ncbi:MAG: MBL fold metallo-hydrolase [Clostridiales bacterium]|nr:MBL fold metallo-hydrolase [Clostridiales bacterium]
MLNAGKLNKLQRKIAFAFALALLAVSLFITVAPKLNLPFEVPGWDDIFSASGMTDSSEALSMPFSAHFIDVGQGDCELVICGEKSMLIDAGETGNSENILSYLKSAGVEKLDYIVVTHPHSDHIGSMAEIIGSMPVENVIMPRLSEENIPTTKVYENLLIALKDSGANIIAAECGDEYTLGDAAFTVLSPVKQYEDLNNMSVVLHFTYGGISYIFMGDAETEAEKDIIKSGLELSSDVIKIGHHGSDTSSSEKFLRQVKPRYAVVSCGAGNSYNHPNAKIVNRITSLGVSLFRTDIDGTVIIATDGKSCKTFKGV